MISANDFSSVGVPWPLVIDAMLICGGLSIAWFLIEYTKKNYTSKDMHIEFEERATEKLESHSHLLELKLNVIKSELGEIKDDIKSNNKSLQSVLLQLAKKS